jgi:hypothetical protein
MLSGCIAIASDTKNTVHTQLGQLLPHVICDLTQQTLFVLIGNTLFGMVLHPSVVRGKC